VEQNLMLSSNFRCYQYHNWQICFGHTLLCYLSQTWIFNKATSGKTLAIFFPLTTTKIDTFYKKKQFEITISIKMTNKLNFKRVTLLNIYIF